MKRSASELVMEAFLRPDGDDRSPPQTSLEELLFPAALGFAFGDRDGLDGGFLSGFNKTFAQNTSKHSTISVNLEAQSSLCAGTPTSSVKHSTLINQALGGTSGSEQSDAESLEIEIEGGPCEQSTNIIDIKHMRRMISNRESARRSRKRKQAHLADLESQVDQLRGENASLFKQLADANQEFTEAATNNRILKSNVEALRIKNKQEDEIANPSQVKMAEDLVTRNTLACSIDHLQVSNVASPQFLNPQQPSRASPDFLPTIEFQGDDSFTGIPTAAQVKNIGPETEGNRVPSGKLWD